MMNHGILPRLFAHGHLRTTDSESSTTSDCSPPTPGGADVGLHRLGVIELFAGIGCVARGFERTGLFEPLVLTDIDQAAAYTYCHNARNSAAYLVSDVRALDAQVLRDAAGRRSIDGLLGCPPCQGFSAAGQRKRGDRRNRLLRHYFEIAAALSPKFILMENVPRVLEYGLLDEMLALLDTRYRFWTGVLNAAMFGLPQTRQRAIVIGYRRDLGVSPSAPAPTHLGSRAVFDYATKRMLRPATEAGARALGLYPEVGTAERVWERELAALVASGRELRDLVRVAEAIDDLPPPATVDEELRYRRREPSQYAAGLRGGTVHNHVRWNHRPATVRKLRDVPEGGGLLDSMGRARSRPYFSQAYTRLHRRGLARTITTNFHNAGSGRFLHYRETRTLTVREAARLQGIEDRFVFLGDMSVQERLVGNAFPVPLATALAIHIASELRFPKAGGDAVNSDKYQQHQCVVVRERSAG